MRIGNNILSNLKENKETVDSKFNQIIIMLSDIIKEINNEDIKGKLSNISVDLFNIQSELYRESKLNEDIDLATATPEEIDDYYFDRLSDEAKNAETAQEKFELTCAATAANYTSSISDEITDSYLEYIAGEAMSNYISNVEENDRDQYTIEEFKKQILSDLINNGRDIKIIEEDIYESNIS